MIEGGRLTKRDFIGYGSDTPDPQWPSNARIAVNIVINYEEGSELSYPDGDNQTEFGLTEVNRKVIDGRDLAAESMFEYGSRVGIWRILRILGAAGVPATVFACARALERNPAVAQAFRELGYDICCHGWRWTPRYLMTASEERDDIARAVVSLKALFGAAPSGWYCRYGPSVNTRALLVEHGGFLYDSDSYNDELPYWVPVGDGQTQHLVIPYTQVHNDGKFIRGAIRSGQDFFEYLRDAFDMLYDEGTTSPKMMSIGLHMRICGHPGRALGLKRFLEYAQSRDHVWFCRREDVARHWMAHHGGPAKA